MIRSIDMDTWPRKAHFAFFQNRKNPCLSLTFPVNVAGLLRFRAAQGETKRRFTDYVYHAVMASVNAIPEFCMRLVDKKPVLFSKVDSAFTYIPKGRDLHANCIAAYDAAFSTFSRNIQAARDAADASPTLAPEGCDSQGLVYLTCLPDIPFTAVANPWDDPWTDSVPRIAMGMVDPAAGTMPVSVEALHSFVDGRHIAAFLKGLSGILETPESSFAS
ncbi:chloramphenicol acetyltransferase [Desulfovibrio sulfodismutans]|uniref:Chloramphenicol acetyltransferase n=1 Tax=Desulfolutivibrio sulfodismutans TaxID=63561 RepID=A0A7K3NNU1_9BACT|nr:CatA-like O-acetyltransferase [Desulfolutivibrio sulfodismutans]NDY57850.1 chloramphenicol acetyltransferase [Desulfolutivibrio sulfodismutans]QLA11591.1 chloramphenicol acetyltransferase [Desulfolutivibrio sulfodismutans DSM 3696]